MRRALDLGTLALAKNESQNAKIGRAATTYAAQASCPASCVFRGAGCYAETGQLGKFVTAPLNEAAGGATPEAVAEAEARAIRSLGADRPLRLHTVGDCATEEAASIVAEACGEYRERGGGPVWTYTHAWRDVPRAAWGNVSVLASCEAPAQIIEARRRGYATALVVPEFPGDRRYEIASPAGGVEGSVGQSADARDGAIGDAGQEVGLAAGLAVLPCPAQTRGVHCTDCRLCFDDTKLLARGLTIGFEVHGSAFAHRHARLALDGSPLAGITSRQWIGDYREKHDGRWPATGEVIRALGLNHSSVYEMLNTMKEEEQAA